MVAETSAVDSFAHLRRRPLSGSGRLFIVQGGIAERSAPLQALETAFAAVFSHSEGYQPSLEAGYALDEQAVEAFYPRGVFLRPAAACYLGDVRTVAEAARERLLQHLHVGGAAEVVIGADDFRTVFPAESLEVLAGLRRGFYLEVGEACAGFGGQFQPPLGLIGAERPGNAAGRHQGDVGVAEDVGDFIVREAAAVQPYLRHFHFGGGENLKQLPVGLIL